MNPKEYQTKDYDEDKGDLMLYGDVKTRTKDLSILGGTGAVEGYFKDEKTFIANDEEEKNNIENVIKIDINNHKDTLLHSITKSGVKHGLEYNYMFKSGEYIKTKPSVVFNVSNKDNLVYTIMIRQPEFVTDDVFNDAYRKF